MSKWICALPETHKAPAGNPCQLSPNGVYWSDAYVEFWQVKLDITYVSWIEPAVAAIYIYICMYLFMWCIISIHLYVFDTPPVTYT